MRIDKERRREIETIDGKRYDRHGNLIRGRYDDIMEAIGGLQDFAEGETTYSQAQVAHLISHASKEARRQTRKTKELLG